MSRSPDPTAKISLLRAAEAVFAENGLTLAKVEAITRLAGLSKGAFYLHFESKEEAFRQVVESFLARCAAILPPPSELPSPGGPTEVLSTWLDIDLQMYEFLWQNRAIVSILQGCQGSHVYLLEAFNRSMHERSKEWLEFWKRKGFVRRELDSDLAATLLSGAHQKLCTQLFACAKKPPIGEWLKKLQGVFARGFGTPLLLESIEEQNPPVSQNIVHDSGSMSRTRGASKRRTGAKVGT